MTEWARFEQEYGPLLVHDRVDYGLAVLRGLLQQDRSNPLPPWHQRQGLRQQSDDDILAVFKHLGKRKDT